MFEKNENEKSELSEMARTLIEKSGECRVLVCADTGSEDPRWHAPVLCIVAILLVKKTKKWSELSEMARTLIGKIRNFLGG